MTRYGAKLWLNYQPIAKPVDPPWLNQRTPTYDKYELLGIAMHSAVEGTWQ
jgi:hypothetical protein